MDSPDKRFSEIVDTVKSWIPRKNEPAYLSRDFWMPDNSCRVCYECDTQFTVFNRKHHCRLCGRVFCAKCTSNSIPALSADPEKTRREDFERIRVCNYCYKQWGEQDVVKVDDGIEATTSGLSPSPSTSSLASSKSGATVNSSVSVGSMPYSTGPYQHVSNGSSHSPRQSVQDEPNSNKQDVALSGTNMEPTTEIVDQSSSPNGYFTNRSDDDDDEYGGYRSDLDSRHFAQTDYYNPAEFDGIDRVYGPHKVHPNDENSITNDLSNSPSNDRLEVQHLEGVKEVMKEPVSQKSIDNIEEITPLFGSEGADAEPVDFENNGLLWLPPEPEDEEDEREDLIFDDDDDDDATGEWGHLRPSTSFGSGESRNRDRSTEEKKKAEKNAVDGHFRALVAQLLQVENITVGEEDDKESWLEIITSLSWEAATVLKPDTSKGGGMDPGGYVKVKCLACGRRSESMVVRGVVCKKNVAHRRMTSKFEKPRFLILGGALEYQRISNLLSSFDTLLQQEMEHLKMAVAKIESQKPNVLLVEKSVSRFAQDYLLEKDISLVLNIKRPLLERIARCSGAQIVPSIDNLSSAKLGHCDRFHVQKFLEEHGSAGQGGKKSVKTLMFFEGCPKPLGCTILLKGASGDELKRVKHVIQYGVFAAYHLALETSFLADEGASLPEFSLKSPITVALPDKPSSIVRSISIIPGFVVPATGKVGGSLLPIEPEKSNTPLSSDTPYLAEPPLGFRNSSGPLSSFSFSSPGELNPSPFLNDLSPYNSYEEKHTVLDGVQKASTFENSQSLLSNHCVSNGTYDTFESLEKDVTIANNHNDLNGLVVGEPSALEMGVQQENVVISQEGDSLKEDFPPSPSDHRSILVSLSTRCVWKGTVCERAHLFRIKYYGNFDKPLGRFLRDHLFDQSYRCRSCEMPSEAHVHCYTHRQGSLTISVKKLPEFLLPGEKEGKIWMWHRCLLCPRVNKFPPATRRIVMSDAAWGLSFGKFLELSFSNHAAASRVATCGHSLHRDCLRFYGFGRMIACFRYASIDVHSVLLPPPKLEFNYDNQDWIQKEADEVVDKAELLFTEVLNALRQIAEKKIGTGSLNNGAKVAESRRRIADLEGVLQKEKSEFEESLRRALSHEAVKGQPVIDILELNRLRRQLLFHSYVWDHRLIYAANSENSRLQDGQSNSLPKNMEKTFSFTEKLAEMSSTVKQGKLFVSNDYSLGDLKPSENLGQDGNDSDSNQPGLVHQEKDICQDSNPGKEESFVMSTSVDLVSQTDPLESGVVVFRSLSEGQTPIVANLSDTLDAAWIGENQSGNGSPEENSSASFDVSINDSSVVLEGLQKKETEEHLEDQGMPEVTLNIDEPIEESSRLVGLPFPNFSRSFSINFSGSIPKIDMLRDYNPVYASSFRELEKQGGARLLLPVGVNDTVIPIYDDEPTSIISYALASTDYHAQMSDERERPKDGWESSASLPSFDMMNLHSFHSFDDSISESFRSLGSADDSILSMSGSRSSLVVDPLIYSKILHVRVSFTDDGPLGKVKYMVTCYYAKRFEALRDICCPSEVDFIRCLSRSKKWGAQGGKSNVFFAKTLDERFIIKQVTKTELESFIKFAPEYFKYLSESISTGSPTCLAKILGIYQVTSKHLKGGKEIKMDVLVMENLLFQRNVERLYDLKGSTRSRYNPDSSGSNKVLLDQNLIEAMPTSPIFVGNKAKRLLERAVWNDTSFLASIDVMDYSLLVGVDKEKQELVLGIIDFMRQYTWDKHLETWVKASGILGGPKNTAPTVISPKQYKKRFRKAMTTYFLMVPDQWSPPTIIPSASQVDLLEENTQGGASTG